MDPPPVKRLWMLDPDTLRMLRWVPKRILKLLHPDPRAPHAHAARARAAAGGRGGATERRSLGKITLRSEDGLLRICIR